MVTGNERSFVVQNTISPIELQSRISYGKSRREYHIIVTPNLDRTRVFPRSTFILCTGFCMIVERFSEFWHSGSSHSLTGVFKGYILKYRYIAHVPALMTLQFVIS